ncbi:MAG: hypothetical protein ACXWL5_04510 [Candidatus Chromulinivorax sp.]
MKHYTKFLQSTTLLFSLIVLISQTTVTQEKETALELTKSNASFTATILALGSATDSSKLQLLPVILQTGIIQAAGSNPALTTTFVAESGDLNVNTGLSIVISNVNTLLQALYTYIANPIDTNQTALNNAVDDLINTEFGSIDVTIGYLDGAAGVTSVYSTTQIQNVLYQLKFVINALYNSPFNLQVAL